MGSKAKKRAQKRNSFKIKAGVKAPEAANDTEGERKPTEERKQHNEFVSAGMAFRVVPVIDTLLKAGKLSQAQYDNLKHYRDQAHRAEDDCAQEGTLAPARMMGGGGGTFGSKMPAGVMLSTPAIIETGRIERELGSLLPIARAVAVDDVTLTRWVIAESGGREQRRGKVTEIVPRNPKGVAMALLELRFAAGRFTR